jgi:DNA adenine methylase
VAQELESRQIDGHLPSLPYAFNIDIYSPFRYPGGKARWYGIVKKWIRYTEAEMLVEPFAGGAHIGVSAAINRDIDKVLLVEKDEKVAAVWETILSGNSDWLTERIREFEVNRESVEEVLTSATSSRKELAFATLLKNRVSRAGLLTSDSGNLRKGENGNGIGSRWYPDTLIKRIREVNSASNRIDFKQGDGLETMSKHSDGVDIAFFIDPPYPKTGNRLYNYHDVCPRTVIEVSDSLNGSFLVTYNKRDEIFKILANKDMKIYDVKSSNSHNNDKTELIITGDSYLQKY